MNSRHVIAIGVAGLTALLTLSALLLAAPSNAATSVVRITGAGIGSYKLGTTGAKAVKSSLYTKPQHPSGCPIIPPAPKGAAGKALWVEWNDGSAKNWTKKATVDEVSAYAAKIGKRRVVTKQGIGVGSKVSKVESKVKHVLKSSKLKKYVPVLSVKDGKGWINFQVQYWTKSGKNIYSWAKLKKQPIESIVVSRKRLDKELYGGSGGC